MQHPKVYIVIVNYRGHDDTIECLESLLRLEYDNYRIVVVDNSQDDRKSLEFIRLWAEGKYESKTIFPDIIPHETLKPIPYKVIVESDEDFTMQESKSILLYPISENKGFAQANNAAIRHFFKDGEATFFWLLNNDTIADKNSLVELVNYYNNTANKDLGIVGSKLLYYYQRDTLQGIGATYNKWLGIVREVGRGQKDSDFVNNREFAIDYVIGASMFVSKKFISEVGLMNEILFLYFEELDWAERAKRRKFNLGYCCASRVYHKLGSSISKKEKYASELSDFYATRNKILITKKYFRGLPIISIYFSFIFFILNRIKRGQWSRIKILKRAMQSARNNVLS